MRPRSEEALVNSVLHRLQPLVILVAEGAVGGAVGDVAAAPEFGDVDLALRIGLQDQERIQLGRIHDRIDVVEELAVLLAEVLDAVFALAAGELADALIGFRFRVGRRPAAACGRRRLRIGRRRRRLRGRCAQAIAEIKMATILFIGRPRGYEGQ